LDPTLLVTLVAVQHAPGTPSAAAIADLRQKFPRLVLTFLPSEDVVNLHQVAPLPALLALLLVLLGLGALLQALLSSTRLHRSDYAVLKAIGLRPRQLAGTVRWQAVIVVGIGLIVGIPLGVLVGRRAWTLTAESIGSLSIAHVPLGALALVVPAALLLAVLVATVPARHAAHVDAGVALRIE
jgi:ABC-type lipoprotein release transport system permease subunit